MKHAHAIYQKTAKASLALANRDRELTPRMRSMLVLLDGKRSTEELARLAGDPSVLDELLDGLVAQGFVEPTPMRPAPVAQPGPIVTTSVPLPEAKRYAARRLTDLLGPNAEGLCLRIEAARTPQELQQAVKRAENIVREFSGSRAACAFMNDVRMRIAA